MGARPASGDRRAVWNECDPMVHPCADGLRSVESTLGCGRDWERAMCGSRWAQGVVGFVALWASMLPVQAGPATQSLNRDVAYLAAALSHDLRTRNDRDLRKLNKGLSKTPGGGSR